MTLSCTWMWAAAGLSLVACHPSTAKPVAAPGADAQPAARALAPGVRAVALPGAPPEHTVLMDYIAYDPAHHKVWVPAGNTGSVDVIDTTDDRVTRLEGFATRDVERQGRKRTVGPSAVAIAGDLVYVGNRGDSSVCAFDAATQAKKSCVTLDSMPDGIQVIPSLHEVWVTTPRDQEIQILDAARPEALALREKLHFDGDPEGFALDAGRGVFYTNLEDKDRTLAIDLKTRQTVHTWAPGCGEDGPKGLAIDLALDYLIVACPEHVVVLDAGHDGKALGRVDTGDGLDAIDYVEARHELFAAAGRAATLTVATLDPTGALAAKAVVPTSEGARNAVSTEAGVAYVTDTPAGRILVVPPAK